MISLSKEWALLSKSVYGQEFIDELAALLKKYNVRTILECGCGDGHILNGLAKQGFSGLGIDLDPEMIALALQQNTHPNISYKQMNWLDLRNLEDCFDAVICRGNSLTAVVSWDKEHVDIELARRKIEESVRLFFSKLKPNGLLYIDTCSLNDVGDVALKTKDFDLKGTIEHDFKRKERRFYGSGIVQGEYFSGGSTSYLLNVDELEEIIRSCNPSSIFRPKLVHEKHYDIVCALK